MYENIKAAYLRQPFEGVVFDMPKCSSVVPFFNNLGEKLFKAPTAHRFFKDYSKGRQKIPFFIESDIRTLKGLAAMKLMAGVAVAGILANCLYQAGKINGEGK